MSVLYQSECSNLHKTEEKKGENSLNLQSCLLNEREEGIRVVKQSKDCSMKWTLACQITF